MSADLFAEFGTFNSAASQQPTQKPNLSNPDPFAFLSSPTPHSASPQSFQPPKQQSWSTAQNQSANAGWASFGTPSPAPVVAQQTNPEPADDDDGWGDFEEAPPSATAMPSVAPASALATTSNSLPMRTRITRVNTLDIMANNWGPPGGGKENSGPVSLKTGPLLGMTNTSSSGLWSTPRETLQAPTPASKPQVSKAKPKNNNADVLFDADDFDGEAPEDEDDDFGDFETGEVGTAFKTSAPTQPAIADLMSLDFGPPATQPAPALAPISEQKQGRKEPPSQLLSTLSIGGPPHSPNSLYPQPPKSPAFSDRNPFPGLSVTTPVSGSFPQDLKEDSKASPDPMTAWPDGDSAREKEDWDSFADLPLDNSSANKGGGGHSGASSSWDWDAVEPAQVSRKPSAPKAAPRKSSPVEPLGPPPTNVPPPSILLSIFTELLEEAETKLYKPTANQPPAVKTRIYADPGTIAFLKGYMVLATVAARILVGRRLRWNRDKFLAQGMSISAAGSKGGMKLAGVDKAQSAREDREAADVIGLWRDYVGKLKTAVAQANIGMQKQPVKMEPLKIPEINDHMAVSTAKMVPTAPKACVICGLKRDERVKGVDFEVEDSFGEWWVEHWGHRTCRNFWLGNEGKLRSR
ncbi:hypothetical protein KVR01_013460 [Diaporthe batatas]|uniref:uncharacterized protein n=1 Tax=Diaporthe batatas TaxID=748121 RepID=UPI001D04F726|nr:uncharacterized protein KVR01_013460 [Diaporthe batatas]KAG8156669.1 hypothetical protein KVR01_013460 [Diaporthe batatas]